MQNGHEADVVIPSDGIARVHGLANVQAEELVEYVVPCPMRPSTDNRH